MTLVRSRALTAEKNGLLFIEVSLAKKLALLLTNSALVTRVNIKNTLRPLD